MGAATPKQYLPLAGASVLERSLSALFAVPDIVAIGVALDALDQHAATLSCLADPRVLRVTGARERSGSVLAGLELLLERAEPGDWVLVHDAARPCVRAEDISTLIATVTRSGVGGLLAEPVVDTIKQADAGGRVLATLDRNTLWRAQTPQMFRIGELHAALTQAHAQGQSVTDEAAAMELAGHPVQLVPSSHENIKITVAGDLPLAEFYLRQRETTP
tara:strand:+ start:4965 stop:5618 length:654 start_codon:yes stop_codon:yes gene_type:complete